MRKGIFVLFFLMSISRLSSQSITPFTLNIAGFTATQNGYSLTVSTGETISITNFKAPNGESLNSGFLQNNPPLVTGIEELLSKIGDNEVNITPNPKDRTVIGKIVLGLVIFLTARRRGKKSMNLIFLK